VAKKRRTEMNRSAHSNHLRGAAAAMAAMLAVVLVAVLVAPVKAKPAGAASAKFLEAHGPIAFERDGDIWVATMMDVANLTPKTAAFTDTDPAVSPDGKYVAFASDRDGDFEIYTVDVTGEVQRLTDNMVYDYNPGWSSDGERITYIEPLLWPEDVRIFSLRITHEVPLPSRE
jgi:dipeptidyl aminopeptidase/acylaminoacyl peptidase